MERSESTQELFAALFKVQAEVTNAQADGENNYFSHRDPKTGENVPHKFISLTSAWSAIRESLQANELVCVQSITTPTHPDCFALTMHIQHVPSGEWIADTGECPLEKANVQGFGSVSRYLRRYMICSFFGIVEAPDDDGESAMGRGKHAKADKPEALPQLIVSAANAKKLVGLVEKADTSMEKIRKRLAGYRVERTTQLAAADAMAWITELESEKSNA